ncbi:MAG: guanylate kinase [Sedimentisphaerales bacterium]|nr:guanylate kinase [Sedimentisphaerales bacterium]
MISASDKKQITGQLFVVSGPSGSGKSTLCRAVVGGDDVYLSVSATTRPRGKEEVDGLDYFFVTEEEFRRKIEAGELLEYARIFEHYYGTPMESVLHHLHAGRNVILEIDVQGAVQVFRRYPQAVGILVLPPDDQALRERLLRRGRDDEASINKRLAQAQTEIEQAQKEKHYRHIIVNDDLEQAVAELRRLVAV